MKPREDRNVANFLAFDYLSKQCLIFMALKHFLIVCTLNFLIIYDATKRFKCDLSLVCCNKANSVKLSNYFEITLRSLLCCSFCSCSSHLAFTAHSIRLVILSRHIISSGVSLQRQGAKGKAQGALQSTPIESLVRRHNLKIASALCECVIRHIVESFRHINVLSCSLSLTLYLSLSFTALSCLCALSFVQHDVYAIF